MKGRLILSLLLLIIISFQSYSVADDQQPKQTKTIENNETELIKRFEKDGESSGEPSEVKTTGKPFKSNYKENSALNDFEVHFFISLPFTALYSYVAVSSLDAMVQGKYPTAFRTTNTWMIIGLAVGSSTAIALGSIGRVPDQSVQEVSSVLDWNEATDKTEPVAAVNKMELLKILY